MFIIIVIIISSSISIMISSIISSSSSSMMAKASEIGRSARGGLGRPRPDRRQEAGGRLFVTIYTLNYQYRYYV